MVVDLLELDHRVFLDVLAQIEVAADVVVLAVRCFVERSRAHLFQLSQLVADVGVQELDDLTYRLLVLCFLAVVVCDRPAQLRGVLSELFFEVFGEDGLELFDVACDCSVELFISVKLEEDFDNGVEVVVSVLGEFRDVAVLLVLVHVFVVAELDGRG